MAEAVLGLVMNNVVPLLTEEAKLLRGVRREVDAIKSELQSIQSFIKDADEKAEKDERSEAAKIWVNEFRQAAYGIEEVIDRYVLHVATEQYHHPHRKLLGSLERAMCWVFRLRPRHRLAKEITEVKQRIQSIKDRGQTYGFSTTSSDTGGSSGRTESGHDPRTESLFLDEAEVVGIEDHREELIEWLANDGESKRQVVALVGMGGTGKTTLAKKVYDSPKVTDHFSNKAWITVSQSYKVEELLRRTLEGFYEERDALYEEREAYRPLELDAMEEPRLINELREYLKQTRYVVVFDDVWQPSFWSEIHRALPDDSIGSRVLITTRKEQVASVCMQYGCCRKFEVKPLSEENGFELFCKKLFSSEEEGRGSLPPDLKQLSHDIVNRCEGFPLLIVAVAGILRTKKKNSYCMEGA